MAHIAILQTPWEVVEEVLMGVAALSDLVTHMEDVDQLLTQFDVIDIMTFFNHVNYY